MKKRGDSMAVNFKKLISYSIDNKYEKIYNYLKINRHLELTKDDIDKIMDLDFDIKLKIQFIQKIKEEIYAVVITDDVMKYFMYRVTSELGKDELQLEEIMCFVNTLKFFYSEYTNYLKTNGSNIDDLFVMSMQLLQKEVNEQIPDYKELDEMIDTIYMIRIAELCTPEIFNDKDVLDKEIKKLEYIILSPLLSITNMNYDNTLNYISKRISKY